MRIIECTGGYYDVSEMEGGLGRAYKWRPEMVMVECDCGKRSTHKRADLLDTRVATCECGQEEMARDELLLQLIDEEWGGDRYPWRSWQPCGDAGMPF